MHPTVSAKLALCNNVQLIDQLTARTLNETLVNDNIIIDLKTLEFKTRLF